MVLTNKLDISADWVVRELSHREADFVRLNTEDLPAGLIEWRSNGEWKITTATGQSIESLCVSAVWYRRPGHPFGDRVMQDSPAAVLNAQWRACVEALLLESPTIRWVNHPIRNSRAESKIWQLTLAQRCGLRVPQTVVTNSADLAACHERRWERGAVLKALDAPLMVVRGQERFVFTTRMESRHLADPLAFATAPVIVQERIEPRRDLRVTVVGNRVFAAEATGVTEQDWRLERRPAKFQPYSMDPDVAARCIELVRRLGLTFGAIDFVDSPMGLYFLELNPNGEWGWLQASGLPVASAIVDELLGSNSN